MAAGHKDQHWVPRSYLAAWCDPACPLFYSSYVHVFSRDGSRHYTRAPGNLFTENNMYTIERTDGQRDLHLEHGLGTIEDEFARLRPKIERRETLDPEENGWLLTFAAASLARTPVMREHQRDQWRHVLEVGENFAEAMRKMPEDKRRAFAGAQVRSGDRETGAMSLHQVRAIVEEPMQRTLGPLIKAQLEGFALVKPHIAILCHEHDPGFVTSDAPCAWIDPALNDAPPLLRHVGLASPTMEILLPISPTRALMLSHRGEQTGYVDVREEVVHEFNRTIIGHCDQEFVCRRDQTHPWWFVRDPRALMASLPETS